MSHRLYRAALVGAIVVATNLQLPTTADACWLFGRRRRQVTYYAPATTAPVAAPAAATGGCCGPAQCMQTVVRYAPQTAYRTVWSPVPVTTYKTTTSCNPTTGLPMTCTRPCTSYQYQARRVPYTTYRAYYAQVPVTMPGTAAAAPASYSAAYASYAAPQSYAQSYATQAAYTVPGYTPGTTNLGSCNGCGTAPAVSTTVPAVTSAPAAATTVPGYTAAPANGGWTNIGPATSTTGSTDPADVPPSLNPQDVQRIDPLQPGSTTSTQPLIDDVGTQGKSILAPSGEHSTTSERFRSNLRLIPNPRQQPSGTGAAPAIPAVPSVGEKTRTASRFGQQRTSVPIIWASRSQARTTHHQASEDIVANALLATEATGSDDAPRAQVDNSGWRAHRPR